jgi:hypothetical protein
LDKVWELAEGSYSRQLVKQMVWLSALVSYEQCAQVFRRIGEHWIPPNTIWRYTQREGARLSEVVQDQVTAVAIETYVLPAEQTLIPKGLSVDGGMVHIRGEGWRELKVGVVFDLQTGLEKHPVTEHLLKMTQGINLQYTAVLGNKDTFKPRVWALGAMHDFPSAIRQALVADGAAWIWDMADELFPDATQIVDWYHALHHLNLASQTLYPNDDPAQQKWLKSMQTHLYDGNIAVIIAPLIQAGHPDLAHYFEVHQSRMTYTLFRQQGLTLGSGTVESGVKQFKHRLAGAGMCWNAENAQRMIVIRAAVLSDSFDDLWAAA